jgi:two-component system phosphate regulon sensor histidine kinase PhoR
LIKSLPISRITVFITGIIIATNGVVLIGYFLLNENFVIPYLELIALIILALINFLFVRNILERFVFRKIKILYKIITDRKLSNVEKENLDSGAKSIEQVSDDVTNWANSKKNEIEKLKSLSKYRKDFVGAMSHELKTPLFSIQGYLHTLIEGGIYDKKVNIKYLKSALRNVDRLESIVNDLETIYTLESNSRNYEMRNFDLIPLIKEIFEDLNSLANEKKTRLNFKEVYQESFIVTADKESIRRVLNNLIINAIKYGKEEGKVDVGIFQMEKLFLIEVSDNGDGIEEKHIKHLFDRFYRIDDNRSRKIGGSGLGLSIVKHILEAHQQNINVRSTPGIGSTFGFTLKKGK